MLRPPVRQTMCGHRLCAICLEEVLQSENTMCPGQEDDEEECVDLKSPDSVNVTQCLSFSFMLSGNNLYHPQLFAMLNYNSLLFAVTVIR